MSSNPHMLFDTHKLIKQLITAGVPESQAEAHIQIISNVTNDQLITRAYFDIKMHEIDLKFKELENSLTIRMGTMLFIGITVVATLVKLF
jgi:ribosomal protein L11